MVRVSIVHEPIVVPLVLLIEVVSHLSVVLSSSLVFILRLVGLLRWRFLVFGFGFGRFVGSFVLHRHIARLIKKRRKSK
jgi:hypothetical protein